MRLQISKDMALVINDGRVSCSVFTLWPAIYALPLAPPLAPPANARETDYPVLSVISPDDKFSGLDSEISICPAMAIAYPRASPGGFEGNS